MWKIKLEDKTMTMQVADYVTIGRKKYVLIDVEKDKQIITCADFDMPDYGIIPVSTACWRGYMADYYVIRKILYGIKSQDIHFENSRKNKKIKSSKTIIPYTGSCIIAYGDECNSDFISSYIDYDEAFELYFENGILKEKLTLASAIEKAKAFSKTDEYNNKMEPYERGNIREQIAREPLKYNYDKRRTYKWRKNNDDDDDE
jgi:hypothetical protein